MNFNLLERAKIEKLARFYVERFHRVPDCISPCDILFLHRFEGNITRTQPLVNELKEKFSLKISHEITTSRYLKLAFENPFSKPFPNAESYRPIYDYYASFLYRKYHPKVLVTFMDNAELSHSLRRQFNSQGSKVVNLSHGVTACDQNYEVYDFDYYFVYGQSSVDAALAQAQRRGNTKLVLAGSYLMKHEEILNSPDPNKVVYLSDGTPKADIHHIESIFALLSSWAKANPEKTLYFKYHPLEDTKISKEFFSNSKNVVFLPRQTTVAEAIRLSSVALTGWSNTAIEAALLGRPVISLNPSGKPDEFLKFSNFFGSQAISVNDLSDKLKWIFENSQTCREQNRKFVNYHLSHLEDSISTIAKYLDEIVKDKESFPTLPIGGTI